MNNRVLAASVGTFLSVGAVLWFPLTSSARQTMADQMAATGVAANLNSKATSNVVGAVNKARSVADKASKKVKEENSVWEQATGEKVSPADRPGTIYDVSNLMSLKEKSQFDKAKGRLLGLMGTVELVMVSEGKRVYVVKPAQTHQFPDNVRFWVRMTKDYEGELREGDPVSLAGKYMDYAVNKKHGLMTFMIDESKLIDLKGPGTGDSAAKPEVATFESPIGGWHFQGTVEIAQGIAVFVSPEGSANFIREGELIQPGLRLLKIENGRAEVSLGGKKLDLFVW